MKPLLAVLFFTSIISLPLAWSEVTNTGDQATPLAESAADVCAQYPGLKADLRASSKTAYETATLETVGETLKGNETAISVMLNCMEQGGQGCRAKKEEELESARAQLTAFRENMFWKELQKLTHKYGDRMETIEARLRKLPTQLKVPGHSQKIQGFSTAEIQSFLKKVKALKAASEQIKLAKYFPGNSCVIKRNETLAVSTRTQCRATLIPQLQDGFRSGLGKKYRTAKKKITLLLAGAPWLAQTRGQTVSEEVYKKGIEDRKSLVAAKRANLGSLSEEEKFELLASPSISLAVASNATSPEQQKMFCSVRKGYLAAAERSKTIENRWLLGAALGGALICPFTSPATCFAAAGALGAVDIGIYADRYSKLKKAYKDYYAGILSDKEFEAANKAYQDAAFGVAALTIGPAISGAKMLHRIGKGTPRPRGGSGGRPQSSGARPQSTTATQARAQLGRFSEVSREAANSKLASSWRSLIADIGKLKKGSPEEGILSGTLKMISDFTSEALGKTKNVRGSIKDKFERFLSRKRVPKAKRDAFLKTCLIPMQSSAQVPWWLDFPMDRAHAAASAKDAKCLDSLSVLYDEIYLPNQKMFKELDRTSNYHYYGRTRALIEATDDKVIDDLFRADGGITRADLEEVFYMAMSDNKVPQAHRDMIVELHHMADDRPDIFWPRDGSTPSSNAKKVLRELDRGAGFDDSPSLAAQITDRALGKTEVEALNRVLEETFNNRKYPNSRFYDRFVRFWSPHYYKIKKLLDTNNELRKQLQLMYKMDEPVLDVLGRKNNLSREELSRLEAMASDTGGQLAEVRKDISQLYGREVTASQPLAAAEIRIRDLAKRANLEGEMKDTGELVTTSEKDMDTLVDVMDTASKRGGGKRWPLAERHSQYYKIRNSQYRRETGENTSAYLNRTARRPQRSAYTVKKRWTVTVTHMKTEIKTRTVSDGKGGTKTETYTDTKVWTSSYTKTKKDTLHATYEEVLNNKVDPKVSELAPLPAAQTRGAHAISASNGTPRIVWVDENKTGKILAAGSKVRKREVPIRQQINQAIRTVNDMTQEAYENLLANPQQMQLALQKFEKLRGALTTRASDVQDYLKTSDAAIAQQYPNDIPKDFKARNQVMGHRFVHLANRIEHLEEQLRRGEPHLETQLEINEYPEQMARLEADHKKKRKIQIGSGIGVGVTAAGAGGYYVADPVGAERNYRNTKNYIGDKMNALAEVGIQAKNAIADKARGLAPAGE